MQILSYIYAAFFPFLLFAALEMINTPNATAKWWCGVKPKAFIASGLIVFVMCALFVGLLGSVFVAGSIVAAILAALYVFAYYRLVITGWVFVPKDLSMFKYTKVMAGFTRVEFFAAIAQFSAVVIGLLVLLFFAGRNVNVVAPVRLGLAGFALIVGFVVATVWVPRKIEPGNKVYRENGLLLGFYFNLIGKREQLPEYSREKMMEISKEIKKGVSGISSVSAANKPDVIVIMNEAFSDLNIFEGISFSKDPMANFKDIDAVARGNIHAPVIGGRTCNTEFEFLTGNAMEYIGMDVMPFEWEKEFVPQNDERALPNLFRENGYETVSVHPFMGAFFNRNTIHPKLGFDKCVFAEQMPGAVKKGDYISDEYFTNKVLEEINSATKPLFLYGITMQNHYHYYEKKYTSYDIETTGNYDKELLWRLNAYLQGVYDADMQFARLVAALRKRERPTILLFFGDHKPLLGKTAFELYLKTGVVQSADYTLWTDEQTKLMFSAPYAVWSNFDLPKQQWGNIAPYELAANTAQLAGLNLNLYNKFILQKCNFEKALLQYIQYDKIYGEGYANAAMCEIAKQGGAKK